MKIDSKNTLKTAAVITALGVIGTAAWGFGDITGLRPIIKNEFELAQAEASKDQASLEAQVQKIQEITAVQEFNLLDMKRKFGYLTFDEDQKRCKLAEAIGYYMAKVEGCDK